MRRIAGQADKTKTGREVSKIRSSVVSPANWRRRPVACLRALVALDTHVAFNTCAIYPPGIPDGEGNDVVSGEHDE